MLGEVPALCIEILGLVKLTKPGVHRIIPAYSVDHGFYVD
jgi:hypothetical protein